MKEAIVLAAGSSTRTNLGCPKVLYKINNKEMFLYSVEVFIKLGYKVILVVSKDIIKYVKSVVSDNILVVEGGATRCASTKIGLSHVTSKNVMIHDAARPLIKAQNIKQLEEGLKHSEAVFLASKIVDSVKLFVDGEVSTINRDNIIIAQTPQCFRTSKIKEAHENIKEEFSDDISLYQYYYENDKVMPIINETPNIKVTYDRDLDYAKYILKDFEHQKVGHSYDIHQLVEGRKLILGGIHIPFNKGLLGHSDADCLVHAIAESILGALGLGDLGKHFPDNDLKYKDIASTVLLVRVCKMMDEMGYEISNIDSIIFAQEPKMAPHIKDMKKVLLSILNVDEFLLNIKATTYERLDSIGNGEAIACESVCLLKPKRVEY